MTPTLDDLRAALAESSSFYGPDPEDTLRRVEQRVAASDRRRRVVVVSLVAAVLASGGAIAASGQRTSQDGTLQPGQSKQIPDHSSLPPSVPGLVRISLTEWRIAPDQTVTIALPDAETDLVVRARCWGDADTKYLVVRARDDDDDRLLPCPSPDDAPLPEEPQLEAVHLRPSRSGAPGPLTVHTVGENTVGTARIAVYVRTGPPARPPNLDEDPATALPVHGSATEFLAVPGAPNTPVTVTGRNEANLLISLLVRGPGTLQVTANGTPVRFGCHQDPADLVCGSGPDAAPFESVDVKEYGAPAEVYWGPGPDAQAGPVVPVGAPLTITVTPSGFTGQDWKLQVFRWTDSRGAHPVVGSWTRR